MSMTTVGPDDPARRRARRCSIRPPPAATSRRSRRTFSQCVSRGERAQLGGRVLRVADPQRLGGGDEPGQELVVHRRAARTAGEPARHTCPALREDRLDRPVDTALSRSASANTRLAPLPPSSRLTGVRLARGRAGRSPGRCSDSPVNVIRSTPAVLGQRRARRVRPVAVDDVEHAGRQARLDREPGQHRRRGGVSSAGLSTTVLPQASAGATFQVSSISGKFHGAIAATTPAGS